MLFDYFFSDMPMRAAWIDAAMNEPPGSYRAALALGYRPTMCSWTHLHHYREWRRQNPAVDVAGWLKARRYAYVKTRMRKYPQYRVIGGLRTHLRALLKRRDAIKQGSVVDFIGCSPEQLRQHIEAQFQSGMTWENYGQVWHVDHIRPCASFDLLQSEQQRECFHFSNLQPLFAEENLRKASIWNGKNHKIGLSLKRSETEIKPNRICSALIE